MRLNGKDLISRQTANSARVCTATSAIVIAIERYSLPTDKLEILSVTVPEVAYLEVTFVFLLITVTSLIVHWRGDYESYTKWFKSNEFSGGSYYGTGPDKNIVSPREAVRRRYDRWFEGSERLKENLSNLSVFTENDLKGSSDRSETMLRELNEKVRELAKTVESIDSGFNGIQTNINHASGLLDELDVRFRKVDFWAKFQVFIWYLALPCLATVFALFVLSENYFCN